MARRWLFYLALNVLVSAATMLGVLYWWDRSHQSTAIAVPSPTPLPAGYTTPLPTALPSRTPRVYVVQSGDTLGKIAEKFGVDVDELAAINNIQDPNVLTPGMQLVIPTSAQTEQPVSSNPTVTPQDGEAFPWPVIDSVLSAGVLGNEAVKIVNPGPNATLTGWRLRAPGGAEYAFKEFSLVAQGAVLIHTAEGIDTSIDLYWDLKEPVWHSGDEVQLLDALGNVRSVFFIP
ncbi:MAG: LysM peptidoglycan-binding domain-containing protein [Anaerolineales bacterium]